MTDPIAGSDLPLLLPESPRIASGRCRDRAGGRERPGGVACQAVLRLHHDVLNLSIGMAQSGTWLLPSPSGSDPAARRYAAWWNSVEFGWNLLCGPHASSSSARPGFTWPGSMTQDRIGDGLGRSLRGSEPLLPSTATVGPTVLAPPEYRPVGDFALWETVAQPDERTVAAIRRRNRARRRSGRQRLDLVGRGRGHSAAGQVLAPCRQASVRAAGLAARQPVQATEATLDSLSSEIARLGAQDPER